MHSFYIVKSILQSFIRDPLTDKIKTSLVQNFALGILTLKLVLNRGLQTQKIASACTALQNIPEKKTKQMPTPSTNKAKPQEMKSSTYIKKLKNVKQGDKTG